MGCRIIAVDVVPERLATAGELGADYTINRQEADLVERIQDLTGGMGASAALETSGNPAARSQVFQCLRPFGRCCYVCVGGPASIDFNRDAIF